MPNLLEGISQDALIDMALNDPERLKAIRAGQAAELHRADEAIKRAAAKTRLVISTDHKHGYVVIGDGYFGGGKPGGGSQLKFNADACEALEKLVGSDGWKAARKAVAETKK